MEKPSSSSKAYLVDVLRKAAERHCLQNYKIKLNASNSGADGYVGAITQAEIISNETILHVVIKSCDGDNPIRSVLPIETIFQREAYMYETIFPQFQKFESEHNITTLQFSPVYYDSCNNENCDALVLSNLNKDGYRIYDRKRLLDDEHMQLVIKRYARFHAISLAYRHQKPNDFKVLYEAMEDYFMPLWKKSGFLEIFINLMKKAGACLDTPQDHDIKKVYESFIADVERFIREEVSVVDEFSVIVHGDCWINNMMFRYPVDQPTTPSEVLMFDFQIARLANPMIDIANVFYSSGSSEVIDNVEEYLKHYYICLTDHLKALGCDPENIYPFAIMRDHWKKFARYGLYIRPSILNILGSSNEQHKQLSDIFEVEGEISKVFNYQITDTESYRHLCRHTIKHFVEKNLI